MNEEKTFPIQQTSMDYRKEGFRPLRVEGFRIPWKMAERAYETYSKKYGDDQSIEDMAKRGGFGWNEFCVLYCGIPPKAQLDYKIIAACANVVVVDLLKYYEFCDWCHGKGRKKNTTVDGYAGVTWDGTYSTCSKCRGSGRRKR
jgi:hypothetical protein